MIFGKKKIVKVKGFFIKIIVIIIEELVYGELYIVILKWMVFFMWLMLKNENCERIYRNWVCLFVYC